MGILNVRADEGKINAIKIKHKGLDFNFMQIPANGNLHMAGCMEEDKIKTCTLEISFADVVEVEELIEILEKFKRQATSYMGTWRVMPRKR